MEDLIRFYLLQKPRNVSDIIRDLTEKELSGDSDKRRGQIPRIAGNWFRENSGYIWKLKNRGHIKDSGRQYVINRDTLIDDFIKDMKLEACFNDYDVKGDRAELEDAYESLMEDVEFGEYKKKLMERLFSGSTMADIFEFEKWEGILTQDIDCDAKVFTQDLVLSFKSSIHFILTSSIFKSRKSTIEDKIEGGESYFTWKNRLDRLKENESFLKRKIIKNTFPGKETDSEGRPKNAPAAKLFDAFGESGVELDPNTVELLANMYLLYFKDGVELFDQYSKYDHSINLFFNLLERGWMVDSRNVERDSRTGNFVVPLSHVRSYLDNIADLFHRKV